MAAAAPLAPTPQSVIAAQMAYGPNAGAAFQRSQYLAEALRNLQSDGAQNIRTPTALLANLLADGAMEWSKSKADKQAMAAYQADADAQGHKLFDHTPGDPSYQAPGSSPAPSPTLADAVAPAAQPPPPPPPPPEDGAPKTATAGKVTNAPLLARMMLGEAAGEGDDGMRAVAHVALNRLDKGYGHATSLDQVITAPHQFPGVNNRVAQVAETDPRYQHALALAQAVEGTPDPTNGATLYLNPELQATQGHAQPSWATGPNQRIGHHVFYGGDPQMAQAGPSPGPQVGPQPPMAPPQAQPGPQMAAGPGPEAAPGPQGQPPAAPYQIASNGPTPPPPGVGPQVAASAPPPPVMAAGPQAPVAGAGQPAPAAAPLPAAGAPNPNGGVPHQLVTPQEWQYARQLYNDPRTRQEGIALAQHLHMREASPVEMKPGTYWGQDGKPHAVEQFVDQPSAPNAFTQRSNLDNSVHTQANPAYGALPPATAMSPQGQISQVPIQQQQTFKIPNVNGVFVTGPDGRPQKVGDDQYGPEQVLKMRDNLLGSEPVKLYQQSADAYGSMVAAAKLNPGGMRAYALRDTFARAINPGAVARVGTIQAIKESQGLPAEIKGFFMNLQGDGNVPPEIAQQILDVTHGFVASHYNGAHQLVQSNADYAKRHQIDPADVTVPLGDAPQRFVIPHAAAPTLASPQAAQAAAIQAEIARRRAAGTWTGH